jgi:hypothetical protein
LVSQRDPGSEAHRTRTALVIVFLVAVGVAFVFREPLEQVHPYAPVVLVFASLFATGAVIWARHQMDAPIDRRNRTCCVCDEPRSRWSGLELTFRHGWRDCPACGVGYCGDCKGLLWTPQTTLMCLECGREWEYQARTPYG